MKCVRSRPLDEEAQRADLRALDLARAIAHDERLHDLPHAIVASAFLINEALRCRWPAVYRKRVPRDLTAADIEQVKDRLIQLGHLGVGGEVPL